MTQEAVRTFLFDVLGYKKIDELLKGQKPQDTKIREFLEGTVFGTFRKSSTMGVTTMPLIPRIYRLDELNTVRISEGKIGFETREGRYAHFDEETPQLHLPYLISNLTFFGYMTPEEIRNYVEGFRTRLFPQSRYKWVVVKQSFEAIIADTDFYFELTGANRTSKRVQTAKPMDILFNADADTVNSINVLVSRYYSMIHPRHDSQHKRGNISPVRDIVPPAVPAYLRLVQQIDELTPARLAEALDTCKSQPYRMGSSYPTGQVIDHATFGRGLVIGKDHSGMEIYFPSINQKKTLA